MSGTPRLTPRPVTAYVLRTALGGATGDDLGALFRGESGLTLDDSLEPTGATLGMLGALPALPTTHAAWDTRQTRVAYLVAREIQAAVERAKERWGAERVAIVLGSSSGGMAATEQAVQSRDEHGTLPGSYSFVRHHTFGATVDFLRELLGAFGPAYVISTACSSGGKALGSAQRLLEVGLADAVLVGGVESLCEMAVRGFHGLGILSRAPCRPFALDRKGINIGEGAALLLVEREVDRESDARAWLLGVGESSDGHHMTAPRPDGLGAIAAMRGALGIAGAAPADVCYVNAHGTGTGPNDAAEALAIREVLGGDVWVSSTKGSFGHLLGAAGAVEAVVGIAALERGAPPPNVCEGTVDLALGIRLARPGPARSGGADEPALPSAELFPRDKTTLALSNSFAFGGSNVSVLLGRGRPAASVAPALFEVDVTDVSLWTPGFLDLSAWLGGEPDPSHVLPECSVLPVRGRGRASVLSRLLIEVGSVLGRGKEGAPDLSKTPSVFASSCGEMATTVDLLGMMAEPGGELSPVRFQASVHNTASGILSIALGSQVFSTALAAGGDTVAAALIEAFTWVRVHGGALFVAAGDEEPPRSLAPDLDYPALGVGLLLEGRNPDAPRPERALGTLVGFSRDIGAETSDSGIERDGAWRHNPCSPGVGLVTRLRARRVGRISLRHPDADPGAPAWSVDVR